MQSPSRKSEAVARALDNGGPAAQFDILGTHVPT